MPVHVPQGLPDDGGAGRTHVRRRGSEEVVIQMLTKIRRYMYTSTVLASLAAFVAVFGAPVKWN
ncbi:hypothetical protein BH24ACT15_BH24ACT15_36570 [soil metagenome]|jgi:hypothetical protein